MYAQNSSEGPAPVTAAPAPPTTPPAGNDLQPMKHIYELGRTFRLNCSSDGPGDFTYTWKVNGTAVAEATELKGRTTLENKGNELAVAKTTENDFGRYECAVDGDVVKAWSLEAHAVAKLPKDSGVVEGQELKLTCRVYGKPYPRVAWYYRADAEDNFTDVSEAFGERVKLTDANGVPGAYLSLKEARPSDAGVFRCVPEGGSSAETVLRVKDMYAALWPFLGICLEVFVLCAIILVYEKRRTKPELDDSDTDNHDQ